MSSTDQRSTSERLLPLAGLAIAVGALSGLVAALFRLALQHADHWRESFLLWSHGKPALGFLAAIGIPAAATALAASLVRRFSPQAGGSGIPHVEAVVNRELPPATIGLVPIKFVGGWLAIGSGLALGREGPSVQM